MKNIKMLVMDVDGTLTDGCIYMGPQGEAMKAFNAQDGYGIAQILPKLGITPVIITGRSSQILENRAAELKITQLHQGIHDKLTLLQKIAQELGAEQQGVAYIGDDLNDLDCIRWCGFTGCPADAVPEIRAAVNFVSSKTGGRGAVREFVDYIRDGD